MGGGLGQSRRAGWHRGGSNSDRRCSGDLQECGGNATLEFTQVCTGESDASACTCEVQVCGCLCLVSHIGGFVGGRAVYVSHRFQDVEGDEANLVEPIATLPPALRGFNHLSGRGAAVSHSTTVRFLEKHLKNATTDIICIRLCIYSV